MSARTAEQEAVANEMRLRDWARKTIQAQALLPKGYQGLADDVLAMAQENLRLRQGEPRKLTKVYIVEDKRGVEVVCATESVARAYIKRFYKPEDMEGVGVVTSVVLDEMPQPARAASTSQRP